MHRSCRRLVRKYDTYERTDADSLINSSFFIRRIWLSELKTPIFFKGASDLRIPVSDRDWRTLPLVCTLCLLGHDRFDVRLVKLIPTFLAFGMLPLEAIQVSQLI